MVNPYSAWKAAWHLDDIAALRAGEHIPPRHIQFIMSDLCNQNCSFCSYRAELGVSNELFSIQTEKGLVKNPNRQIPTEKCYRILEDCWEIGVKAIEFTGGGEPTVHKDCEAIIQRAQDLGLKTALVSNGTKLLSKEVLERLSWLRISLDAGTEATYASVRESKAWPKVMENLEYMAGIEGPLFGVGFVVTQDNWKELVTAAKLIKSLNGPYMRIAAMMNTEGSSYFSDIYQDILELLKEVHSLETDTFKIYDIFGRRIEDLDIGTPRTNYCGQQRFNVYIGGDQKIYRCCTTAYTTQGYIGDISKQSFAQWWRKEAEGMYNNFDAKTCVRCQFNVQNEILTHLVGGEPIHADFV